jgi:asparagine synthase (glutamine-hydrolysing)
VALIKSATQPSSVLTLCLGNTRLAIIDKSTAGHQPMLEAASGNWITYNGETYNFGELRREIGDEFGPWYSRTDTEVVLRAYRKWGTDAFQKFRGMFALAIWDETKQELILARDRHGIKPLYYYASDITFVFASEVRALLASSLVPRRLSSAGIASYLNFGSVQAPLSIIEGVHSLLPGECIRIGADGQIRSNFFVTEGAATTPLQNRSEAVARLRAELEDSVRSHLVSDVPLGVFLSGGMDSSALVALMSRVTDEKPRTFSVVFDENKFNEQSYSRAAAEKFQTVHCEVHLNDQKLFQMLPAALSALDQPTMDGTNTYVISKAVKESGVTVALSGLGGDELFAGYPSFKRALRLHSTPRLGRTMLRGASGLGSIVLNGSTARKKFWQLCAGKGTPAEVYNVTRQLFDDREVQLLTGISPPKSVSAPPASDPINAISHFEMTGYMANTLLRDTDSMSMAHSLEVRVPFVDPKVVSSVFNMPGEWKLGKVNEERPKPLLADALADLLPKEFVGRRKMGFTLPLEQWTQSRLKEEMSDVFARGGARLNPDVILKTWSRFLKAPQAIGWTRPWSLYVLIKWCEINDVR